MVWSCFKWHLITGFLYERQFQQFKVLPTFFFNGANKIREMFAYESCERWQTSDIWKRKMSLLKSDVTSTGEPEENFREKVANKNSFSLSLLSWLEILSAFSFKGTQYYHGFKSNIQKNKCRILLTAFGGKAVDNFIE